MLEEIKELITLLKYLPESETKCEALNKATSLETKVKKQIKKQEIETLLKTRKVQDERISMSFEKIYGQNNNN